MNPLTALGLRTAGSTVGIDTNPLLKIFGSGAATGTPIAPPQLPGNERSSPSAPPEAPIGGLPVPATVTPAMAAIVPAPGPTGIPTPPPAAAGSAGSEKAAAKTPQSGAVSQLGTRARK